MSQDNRRFVLGTIEVSTITQLKWRFNTQEAPQHEMVKTKQEIKLHEVEWKKQKTKPNFFWLRGASRYDVVGAAASRYVQALLCCLKREQGVQFLFSSLHKTSLNLAAKQYYTIMFEVILAIVIVRLWINLPLNMISSSSSRISVPTSFLEISGLLRAAPDDRPSLLAAPKVQIDFLRLLMLPGDVRAHVHERRQLPLHNENTSTDGNWQTIKGNVLKVISAAVEAGWASLKAKKKNANCHSFTILICK